MRKRKFSKNEIEDFVKNSKTYADVCRKCGWEPRGDNYKIDSAISSKEIGWLHRFYSDTFYNWHYIYM